MEGQSFVLTWTYRGEDTEREKVKTEAKMAVAEQCGHKPRKPKNANHHQKLEEPWNRSFQRVSREHGPANAFISTSGLQICEKVSCCCFKLSGSFVMVDLTN